MSATTAAFGPTKFDKADKITGLGVGNNPSPLFMDPADNKTLITFTNNSDVQGDPGRWKIYQTTSAAEPLPTPTPTAAWRPISQQFDTALTASFAAFAAPPVPSPTPRSNLIFGSTCNGQVWRTTDLTTWTLQPTPQLPGRCLRDIKIDTLKPCDANICTLYVVADNFNAAGGNRVVPGHVFRSADAGGHWSNMNSDTGLPDVPANRVVVHPFDSNTVFVATDLGLYRGTTTDNGATWAWCAFMDHLPQTALVSDLVVHPQSGVLRVFTYGRSIWETQLVATTAVPDKENAVNTALTASKSPRISTGTGYYYDIGWIAYTPSTGRDNVYLRGYGYDASGNPTALSTGDIRVDDTSTHNAQFLSVAAVPTSTSTPYCAWFAWNDDRLGSSTQHVYYQYACSDGYRFQTNDIRADTSTANATNPALGYAPSLDFAIAWQAERAGPTLHDIYVRFFNNVGYRYSTQCGTSIGPCKVNTSTADATLPAAAAFRDGAGNNVAYVAWQESDATTGKIMVSKYNADSRTLVVGPTRIDEQGVNATRRNAALAVDDTGRLIVTWSEQRGSAPEKIFGKVCSADLSSCSVLDANCRRCVGGNYVTGGYVGRDCQTDADCAAGPPYTSGTCGTATVSCPPAAPAGAQTGQLPAVATDLAGTMAVAWQGNANDPNPTPKWSGFARTFSTTGSTLRKDFRVDLARRNTVQDLGVTRARALCAGGLERESTVPNECRLPRRGLSDIWSFPVRVARQPQRLLLRVHACAARAMRQGIAKLMCPWYRLIVLACCCWATRANAAAFAYITNFDDGTVSVIDTDTNSVVATVPVGPSASSVAVHPSGTPVYVAHGTNEGPGVVSVIDAVTNAVVATLQVVGEGIAVAPDGKRLYAVNGGDPGTVSVLDTATYGLVALVPVGRRPRGVAVSPDGRRAYVANTFEDSEQFPCHVNRLSCRLTVSVIDTVINMTIATVPMVGIDLHGIVVNPRGNQVYVAGEVFEPGLSMIPLIGVAVIDPSSNTLIKRIPAAGDTGIAVDPTGART